MRAGVERRTIGSVPVDGAAHDVHALRLANAAGLVVEVWTHGATLVEVSLPTGDGARVNTVVRLPDLDAYLAHRTYVGVVMGRFCRIVRDGRVIVDGVAHQLSRNADGHHLHGGHRGFDRRLWRAHDASVAGRPGVRLETESPDGEEGYPGTLRAAAEVRLHDGLGFDLVLSAHAESATVAGLTGHAFWNLGGAGTVDDHELRVAAGRAVACADLLPLPGPPRPVDDVLGHRVDRSFALAGRRVDDFLVLDDPVEPGPAVELVHRPSGRRLSMWTDQRGLGVYTGDGLTPARAGICFQPGAWPDAPNRPDFPSAHLRAGQTVRTRTTVTFDGYRSHPTDPSVPYDRPPFVASDRAANEGEGSAR